MEIIKSNSKYLPVQPPVIEASLINIKLLFQHRCILDKKGNLYNIEDNKLIRIGLKDFSDNLGNIINKWKDYTIILNVDSVDSFNKLCSFLKEIPSRENDIIIDLSTLEGLKKDDKLNIEYLPAYAYVTSHNLSYPTIQESESPIDNKNVSDFSTWILWLDDRDFGNIMNNLLQNCKRHCLSERVIAKQFYSKFAINSLLDNDKVEQMVNWCTKNVNNSDTDDSVLTYRTHNGSALGKAKLLKLLLNNMYTKIECNVECGYLNGNPHAWNVIKLNDMEYRVDTTNGMVFTNIDELLSNGYSFKPEEVKLKKVIG